MQMHRSIRFPLAAAALAVLVTGASAVPQARAQAPDTPFVVASGSGRNARIPLAGGRAIYEHICQGCHMPEGKGAAMGPGAYPALAGNARLAAKLYPAMLVVKGQGAMPAFGAVLADDQVAAVVNYVRGSFGNRYADALSPGEVATLRPATQSAPTELRGR